jgi:hypothetical protein
MADQTRNKQNRDQGTQQNPGNPGTRDDSMQDDTRDIGQTDRERSNREPSSVADDRGVRDRSRGGLGDDRVSEELGADTDPELDIDDEDREDLGNTGRDDR